MRIDKPSVQSVFVDAMVGDQQIGAATAFHVQHRGRTWFVTNWHVAAGRHPVTGQPRSRTGATPERLDVLMNEDRLGAWRTMSLDLYTDTGQAIWYEHPTAGRGVDVVAIHVPEAPDMRFYPYELAPTGDLLSARASEGLSVIGFPFGLTAGFGFGVWTKGWIASEPDIDYDDKPMFLIDGRTREGQSGSPVIAYHTGAGGAAMTSGATAFGGPFTRLMGVYSGRVNEQSDLGRVWKVSALVDIIERGLPGNGDMVDPRTQSSPDA